MKKEGSIIHIKQRGNHKWWPFKIHYTVQYSPEEQWSNIEAKLQSIPSYKTYHTYLNHLNQIGGANEHWMDIFMAHK